MKDNEHERPLESDGDGALHSADKTSEEGVDAASGLADEVRAPETVDDGEMAPNSRDEQRVKMPHNGAATGSGSGLLGHVDAEAFLHCGDGPEAASTTVSAEAAMGGDAAVSKNGKNASDRRSKLSAREAIQNGAPVKVATFPLPATVSDLDPNLQTLCKDTEGWQLTMAIGAALAAIPDRISIRLAGSPLVIAALQIVEVGRVSGSARAIHDLADAIDEGRTAGYRSAVMHHAARHAQDEEIRKRIAAAKLLGIEPTEVEPAPLTPPREPRPVTSFMDGNLKAQLGSADRDAGALVVRYSSAPSLALPRGRGAKPLACEAVEGAARSGIACGRRVRLGSIGFAKGEALPFWAQSDRRIDGLVFIPADHVDAAAPALVAAVRHVAGLPGPRDFVIDRPREDSEGAAARKALESSETRAEETVARLKNTLWTCGDRILVGDPGPAHLAFAGSALALTQVYAAGLHLLRAGFSRTEPAATIPATTVRAAGILARASIDFGLSMLAPAALPRELRDARLVYNRLGTDLRGKVALSTITKALADDVDAARHKEALWVLKECGLIAETREDDPPEGTARKTGPRTTYYCRID